MDTRQQIEQQHAAVAQLPGNAPVEKPNDSPATIPTDSASNIRNLNVQDFEQLIYANALAKRPLEAEKAFDLMTTYKITPSLRSINHLMDAYANTNDLEHTIATFKRVDELGLKPDIFTYGTLVKAFVINKRLDDAFVLFEKMKDSSIIPSQVKYCCMFAKAHKLIKFFSSLFFPI